MCKVIRQLTLASFFLIGLSFSLQLHAQEAVLEITSVPKNEIASELPAPKVVEFEIRDKTNRGLWNVKSVVGEGELRGIVEVNVGDTLRVKNSDHSIPEHRIHTNDTPFEHGKSILPGETAEYKILFPHDPDADGPLYDHNVGPAQLNHVTGKKEGSEFWIRSTKPAPK